MTTTAWIILAVIFAACFTGAFLFTLFRSKNALKDKNNEEKKEKQNKF
jgi:organic hydroperoxide reductase OsmC/OhrA